MNPMHHLLKNAVVEKTYHHSNRANSKTWTDVKQIRALLKDGISQEDIAEKWECSVSSIQAINRNACFYDPAWKPIESKHKYGHCKLTVRDVRRIREQISEGVPVERIAIKFKVAKNTIINIRDGNAWKDTH